MVEAKVIGIDLGGTRIRAALMDGEGNILARTSLATEAAQGLEHVLNRIELAIITVAETFDHSQIIGIGIGAPGPLNPKTGVVYSPPNLPGWSNVPLGDILEQRTGLPVFLDNDANAAVMGEYIFGVAKGYRYVVYMTVSTGIGAGVIEDGRLLYGMNGAAGEVGHMTIDLNGPLCNCGNIGCLEVLASGTAIGRRAREILARDSRPSIMRDICGHNLECVNAEIVELAASRGDAVAGEILQQTAVYLGVGVTNILHLYNPEIVIIGGGVAQMGDKLFVPMRAIVEQRAMPAYRQNVPIIATKLGDDIGLYGAAAGVIANQAEALERKQHLSQKAD